MTDETGSVTHWIAATERPQVMLERSWTRRSLNYSDHCIDDDEPLRNGVRQPSNAQWWVLVTVSLCLVAAWPSDADKSLALKFVNWAVDPRGELPVLPGPLAPGQGDDVDAVDSHDLQTRTYDELYAKGGWTRKRLELKVANDPFEPGTERQVLTAIGVLTALLAWRLGGRKTNPTGEATEG